MLSLHYSILVAHFVKGMQGLRPLETRLPNGIFFPEMECAILRSTETINTPYCSLLVCVLYEQH